MRSKKLIKPGKVARASGQYQVVGPRGAKGQEVTMVKGKVMPPTKRPGNSYRLVDRTNNESGRGK